MLGVPLALILTMTSQGYCCWWFVLSAKHFVEVTLTSNVHSLTTNSILLFVVCLKQLARASSCGVASPRNTLVESRKVTAEKRRAGELESALWELTGIQDWGRLAIGCDYDVNMEK
ncbi:hypothetical protein KQX54_015452 [Cotesia glomerata]|uniref:Uncharacterized protein n=1 Tax=Cotesia glomerata TaxID=32391 RepID=A0AAV7IX28_COTGL|nr:hypothetical protein KQX54_015452 [Cotesia glomerata]